MVAVAVITCYVHSCLVCKALTTTVQSSQFSQDWSWDSSCSNSGCLLRWCLLWQYCPQVIHHLMVCFPGWFMLRSQRPTNEKRQRQKTVGRNRQVLFISCGTALGRQPKKQFLTKAKAITSRNHPPKKGLLPTVALRCPCLSTLISS